MIAKAAPWRQGLVITCEHACCDVPQDLAPLFARGAKALGGPPHEVLKSHRGFDAGAQDVALRMADAARGKALLAEASRLVIDLNRSLHHPQLFSDVTRALDKQAQQQLVARFWQPHRRRVEAACARAIDRWGRCHHLAMHSFTPVWHGQQRAVDIGLLYDPKNLTERRLAKTLAQALAQALPELRVRKNQPYQGKSDGLPTALRKLWPAQNYAGIEVEVSQALVHNRRAWRNTQQSLVLGLQSGLRQFMMEHDSF